MRYWSPELLQEGQWHHLAVVLNRAVLKNSSVSIYIDGQHASTQKVLGYDVAFYLKYLIILGSLFGAHRLSFTVYFAVCLSSFKTVRRPQGIFGGE